ncbi:UbiA family prenyltransferase [Halocalculus aciditolerans]|uniref:4-hydroxybenzoate polyprenyltransferase n=1 Tax=Halocalculus aciditolerans TaxID=1383812 RepID=A0A830FAT0_9EURY|nr:UbiA family prenyltransferase [Halocalculus aciditolerans]GGL56059.1 hypothetical protein GCM10009039_12800 [Halocalculus aciditolerans]
MATESLSGTARGVAAAAAGVPATVTASLPNRLTAAASRWSAALVHSSVFLGAVSVCKVATACLLLGVGPNLALAVGFLAPLGVYNLDKAADVEADAATYAGRAAFVRAAGPWFVALSAGALAAAVALGALGGVDALAVTLLPGVATALYTYPVLPGDGVDRLKDVYLVNTGVVAAAWAAPLAALPLAFALGARGLLAADAHAFGALAVVFAWFFLRTTIAAEARNVRDVEGDAAEGVRTLPVVRGVRATRRLLYGLEALSLAVVAAGAYFRLVPPAASLAVLPAVGLSLLVTHRVGRSDRDAAWCTYRDTAYPLTLVALAALLAVP